ncbi:hypothetical protein L6452_15706 [Arctium lappa]|uniref:Uncharacterized protein n=1 Tax=Arctium lappa TaxID=4217 RepID=A0ACB9CPF2_ARCLA|nr:hypothetical protein L6452_15706 [Arctium lappa]
MTDRYFENFMLDFVEEKAKVAGIEEEEEKEEDSLLKLLSTPYPTLSEKLKRAALDLKETVLPSSHYVDVSFLSGRAGVCALGAVVAKHQGNEQMVDYYLNQFKKIKVGEDVPDEIIRGRVGYLWAYLFLNKNLGDGAIPSTHSILGVPHGLAGILYVLMNFELTPDVLVDVKETLKYMINNRFSSGNYPRDEDKRNDELVYWCHGAPGVALTLVKAAKVFKDKEFLEAAEDAAEVVWKRGLLKKVGICHGISGNAYVFLSLYRMTGNVEFLPKANAFACFLLDRAQKLISECQMHGGDTPYSLFEGIGGMAYLFLDMTDPANARFPAHEL